MNKLINELLLLAKIENIDNLKEFTQLNLSKEVEIILSMFESMAYEKQVSIKSNISENIIMNGNKEDIEHIVSALTDNAIKHTKSQKEVVVELKKEKNEKWNNRSVLNLKKCKNCNYRYICGTGCPAATHKGEKEFDIEKESCVDYKNLIETIIKEKIK